MVELNIEALSDDAKAVAGGWFGMMSPGKGDLTFQLQGARPSDRAQAALNELVSVGAISVEAFNRYGGLVYRPLVDCHVAHVWLAKRAMKKRPDPSIKWPLTTPLSDEKEARAVQHAALQSKDQGNG